MTFLEAIIAVTHVLLLILVWRIARDVGTIRGHSRVSHNLLQDLIHRMPPLFGQGDKSKPGKTIRSALADPSTIYVVWIWRNDCWELETR